MKNLRNILKIKLFFLIGISYYILYIFILDGRGTNDRGGVYVAFKTEKQQGMKCNLFGRGWLW